MAYTALYRSYRPNNFSDVVGQNHVVKTLKNAVSENRISHAYVFSGLRGIGKTTIARILARAVNCEHPINGEPCNECSFCKAILENQTTDIIEVDAASNNGVDEIRDILDKVNFLPTSLSKKVYIIDEVHMLTTSAFNALLKTLEEPPSYVMFVLATTEPHKIPSTILSRCQRFDFKQLSTQEIKEHILSVSKKENIAIDDEAADLISEAAEGGMRDALSILDQASTYAPGTVMASDVNAITGNVPYGKLIDLVAAFNASKGEEALNIINELVVSGKEISKITSCVIEFCRDVLLYKTLFKVANSKAIFQNEEFIMLADSSNEKRLFYYIDVLNDVLNKIRHSNSQSIYLEVGVMKIINLASVDLDFDKRIQALEQQLENVSFDGVRVDNNQLNVIESRVKKLVSDVENLKANDVDTKINNKLALFEEKIMENVSPTGDLTDIENRLKDLENAPKPVSASPTVVESAPVDLSPINEKIASLEEALNNYINSAKEKVAENQNNEPSLFDEPQETLNSVDLETYTKDLNLLKASVSSLSNEINELKNRPEPVVTNIPVSTLFTEDTKDEEIKPHTHDDLTSLINELELKVTNLNNQLLANDQDDQALKANFNELRNKFSELETKVCELENKEPVVKVVEKVIEKPVEVIKEVEKQPVHVEPAPTVAVQNPSVSPVTPMSKVENDVSETEEIDLTNKIYDIHILERVLNEALSKECRDMKPNLLAAWDNITKCANPVQLSIASVLASGQLRANGNNCIIISFSTAQICNMLMTPDTHVQAREVIKAALGLDFDFLALPDDTWTAKRMEFASQHSVGLRNIKLDPFNNPSLRIVEIRKIKSVNDKAIQAMNALFGDE